VLTIDYEAASAALEEAQARGLSRIRQLDWAGRSADEIAGSASLDDRDGPAGSIA
jgi:5-methylthioadenosine/S-adenosylhomocysteine deaminase